MPISGYESMSFDQKRKAQDYEAGYDWIPDRFGPPPGIPRARKEQLGKSVLWAILHQCFS